MLPRTDLRRDAEKYNHLVNALRRATREIRRLTEDDELDLDQFLERLLPLFTRALDAKQAFAAKQLDSPNEEAYHFSVTVVHGNSELIGKQLRLDREEFGSLINEGQAWLYTPLGEAEPTAISHLQPIQAYAAVLVRLSFVNETYIVGVYNKRNIELEPFLAADRDALDSIVKLIVGGAHLSAQHRREYEVLQKISEQATLGDPEALWLPITQEITHLTSVRYTTLASVNRTLNEIRAEGTWDIKTERPAVIHWSLPIDESSMNGYVVLTGTPHYAPDAEHEPHFKLVAGSGEWGICSAFCVPLQIGGETIGTIYLASESLNGISIENQECIKRIAPHVAVAFYNAKLLREAENQRTIQERVIEIQHNIADVLSWEEQLIQIRTNLSRYYDTEGFFLALYDAESGMITFPKVYEQGQKISEKRQLLGTLAAPRKFGDERGTVDWVIRNRKSLLVEDFESWPERHLIDGKFYANVKSCLLTPMINGGQVTGVIGLRSYKRRKAYNHYDQQILESLSSDIAVVIENARNYEQRLREAKAVSKFQQLISSLEVDPTSINQAIEPGTIVRNELNTIYPYACEALQNIGIYTDDMLIALYDQTEGKIDFALVYETGKPVTGEVIDNQEYYRSRKLDERMDLVNWLLRNNCRETLLLNKSDYAKWNREHPDVTIMPTRSKSFLGTALIYRDKLIGALVLRDLTEEKRFNHFHEEMLTMIASQVAIVIGNAQLYEQSHMQRREIERALNIAVMGAWEAEIGHHVNTEVGAIRRELYKIDKYKDALPKEVEEHLVSIQQYTQRLALPELYYHSTPDFAAEGELYDRPFVDEVIENEVKRLRREIHEDNDDVVIVLALDCPEKQVQMHELWLRRCLRHFISNARKHRSPDRSLCITINSQVSNMLIQIGVHDNGKGVDAAVTQLLFKQPIPVPPEQRHRSMGRGLALVGFVCERYKGSARLIHSHPTTGSHFELMIPVANDF